MDKLEILLGRMMSGGVISSLSLTDEQVEEALTERENDSFSTRWMSIFHKLEAEKTANGISKDADPGVTKLRESAYLHTFKRWKSPDLAALISDDFGLVGDAIVMGYSDPWLNALFDTYLSGRFPQGKLLPRPGGLTEKML